MGSYKKGKWRTERDLNPRYPFKICTLSRGVVSAAHPSVRALKPFATCKLTSCLAVIIANLALKMKLYLKMLSFSLKIQIFCLFRADLIFLKIYRRYKALNHTS